MGHTHDGRPHSHGASSGTAARPSEADLWPLGQLVEDFVRSQLPPTPARVLEVGCGAGELARALVASGWRVTGVDPQAPAGELFVQTTIEDLDAAAYEPFDAAIAVLSLHHVEDIGSVVDKIRSLLKPGGVFVVDEFSREHLGDEATSAFSYYQRLALLHAGRTETGGGQPNAGESFESWRDRVSEIRAGLHEAGALLAALDARFTRRSLAYGPFLFRQGLDPAVEPLERTLIAEGGIRATGMRWVGVREAESRS